jgi:Flp pilus assembly protein TadG
MKELTMHTNKRRTRRGQTVVLLALALVPVVGMAGLGVDVGRMYTARRRAQEVADIAASAGAHEQMSKGTKASFNDVVTSYASRNGFTSANGDIIVTNKPPTSGPYQGNADAYEVIIKRPVPTTLLRVLGTSATTIQGRAVALVKKTGIGILVLDPSKAGAFKINKKSSLKLMSGNLQVNSDSNQALKVEDDSILNVRNKPRVVGSYSTKKSGQMSPLPLTGVDVVEDPLINLEEPPCPPVLPIQYGTAKSPQTKNPSNNGILCPGVYYGGIKVDKKKNVTLSACGKPPSEAVFVLTDKGLHVHDSDLEATGVTIFNTNREWCDSAVKKKNECGSIHFDAKSTVELTPPTSGTYEGVAIYNDRDCKKKLDISAAALGGIEGEIYAPAAELKVKGSKKKAKASQSGQLKVSIVVKKMSVGNNVGVDDADEDDGQESEEAADDDELDFTFNSTTGASARRVVLFE